MPAYKQTYTDVFSVVKQNPSMSIIRLNRALARFTSVTNENRHKTWKFSTNATSYKT